MSAPRNTQYDEAAVRVGVRGSAEWQSHDARGISASEVPALFGRGVTSVAELLLRKRLQGLTAESEPAGEEALVGLMMERTVIEVYERRHPGSVVTPNPVRWGWARNARIAATPDAIEATPNGERTVQVKCTGRTWRWADGVPDEVVLQMHTEMLVCGALESVALVLWGLRVLERVVPRDERMCGEIVSACEKFLCALDSEAPFVEDEWIRGTDAERRALSLLLKEQRGETGIVRVLPDPAWVSAVSEIERMRRVMAAAEARKRLFEARLLAAVGEPGKVQLGDGTMVTVSRVAMPERTLPATEYLRLYLPRARKEKQA